MLRDVLSILVAAFVFATAIDAHADTIQVCWDGSAPYTTIQGGIDAASDGDEVVVCPGTYQGIGNTDLSYQGKAIVLRSQAGPQTTIIDCEGTASGFLFDSGEDRTSVLEGFTILNGLPILGYGGGIRSLFASPTISNCIFTGCLDAAISTWNGSPLITDCIIEDGLAVHPHATAAGLHLAGTKDGEDGGTPVIRNCVIRNNTASYGAGIECYGSTTPLIINCLIVGNIAKGPGSSEVGGGILCNFSSPTIVNCTIEGNSTVLYGGGIAVWGDSSPTVINSIIRGNTAATGGQVALRIRENRTSSLSVSYSNLQGGEASISVEEGCVLSYGSGNLDVNPLFVNGSQGNYHLRSTSPCIDAGDNDAVPSGVTTDLDGNSRFRDSATIPDSGNGIAPIVDLGPLEFWKTCGSDVECDDGLFCTGVESCNAGLCETSGNPCGLHLCDDVSDLCYNCQDDSDCPNNVFCDGADTCVGGVCHPQDPPICDDLNVCTVDSCDLVAGCVFDGTGVTIECDDDDPCTLGDQCSGDQAGTCSGTLSDADGDGIPDGCDICPGGDDTLDSDGDGVPDECDHPFEPLASNNRKKNRYISFDPNNAGEAVMLKVTLTGSLPHPLSVGSSWWVMQPIPTIQNIVPKPLVPAGECVAFLGNEAFAAEIDWTTAGCQTLHVTGCPIEPMSNYEVQAVLGAATSDALHVSSALRPGGGKWWGDTVGVFDGVEWTAAQGVMNIDDAVVAIKTWQGGQVVAPVAGQIVAHLSVPDVEPANMNAVVNFADVQRLIFAFQGEMYPFGPADVDGNCP